jgi:hypothetical protein
MLRRHPNLIYLPKLLHNFRAKTVCSCLWLEQLEAKRCQDQASFNYPYYGEKVDYKNQTVSFSWYGLFKSEVTYTPEQGCQFSP